MTILWWGLGRGPNLSRPVFLSSLLGQAWLLHRKAATVKKMLRPGFV